MELIFSRTLIFSVYPQIELTYLFKTNNNTQQQLKQEVVHPKHSDRHSFPHNKMSLLIQINHKTTIDLTIKCVVNSYYNLFHSIHQPEGKA